MGKLKRRPRSFGQSSPPALYSLRFRDPAGHCCCEHHHAGLQGVLPTASTESSSNEPATLNATGGCDVTRETQPQRDPARQPG